MDLDRLYADLLVALTVVLILILAALFAGLPQL
jgi:hypothetical protein